MTLSKRTSALSQLKSEFRAAGLDPKQAIAILPDWWEEALSHPSGILEVRGFAAKYFGLEIGPAGQLIPRSLPAARFKTHKGIRLDEVASARSVATAVARIVANATIPPWQGTHPMNESAALPGAAEIRNTILQRDGRQWVGLADLIDICWTVGVPVVHLPQLPVGTPKMDGMVTFTGGRPVILLTKKVTLDHPAWMLFILAHEMGHLGHGHLQDSEGDSIVDEGISEDAQNDVQEREANAYATELLSGNRIITIAKLRKPRDLAVAAIRYGSEHRIDPGHVTLNAIANTSVGGKTPWGLAQNTLKLLGHDGAGANQLCLEAQRKYIDSDKLSNDAYHYLEKMSVI